MPGSARRAALSDAPEPPAPEAAGELRPIYANLLVGDHLPSLFAPCAGLPRFAFNNFAGRYHLYGFFLAADQPQILADLAAIQARRRDLFDDRHCAFTGVSIQPADREVRGLRDAIPGVRFAFDADLSMSRACGVAPQNYPAGSAMPVRRSWILVDPSLHVLRVWPMADTPLDEVLGFIAALPPPDRFGGLVRPAPVLVIPNVLEPELCQRLIALYDAHGGEESGVHRDGGHVLEASFKRRRDHTITDSGLNRELNWRIARRVTPEIEKLFYMRCDYIERHIVGCYAAEDGGHFAPHTDNGGGLTAHRRFAVSINLSADFDGGEVVFPEYNTQGYKAPPGWAVVFPCAILHGVRPVTRGARYAFLPFVYDETGQAIRKAALAGTQAEAKPPA